jgi:glycerol-3-phosphate cytidylyltransferase
MPKVYVGGSFDLPHHGHYRLLQKAAEMGDVTVALNLNDFSLQYKNKSLVMSYEERREILLGCKWVSSVVPNVGGADSKQAISLVQPDYLVLGSDWQTKDYHSQLGLTQEWLDSNNIKVVFFPYTEEISTTNLRKRVLENE